MGEMAFISYRHGYNKLFFFNYLIGILQANDKKTWYMEYFLYFDHVLAKIVPILVNSSTVDQKLLIGYIAKLTLVLKIYINIIYNT